MELSVWLAFVAASAVVLISPGPTVFHIMSLALRNGRKTAVHAPLGVALGDLIAIILAAIGLGILLKTSLFFFTLLKLFGGVYLVCLGFKAVTNTFGPGYGNRQSGGGGKLSSFVNSALITVSNPKSIVFFVAFVPLFINESDAYISQAVVIVSTFVALGFVNAMMYSVVVSYLKDTFLSQGMARTMDRIAGGLLAAFGIGLPAYNRSR